MTPEERFEQLQQWGLAQRPRILIRRRPMTAYFAGRADGEAWVEHGSGQIDVWVAPDDPKLPVIAAHEVGHARRELADLMSPAYLEARLVPKEQMASLPLATRELVLEEETLAWGDGRKVLAELGFDDWTLFEQTREQRLGVYRDILSLEAA